MTALSKEEARRFISRDEYIEGELKSHIRHEYRDGEVFAMAGASANHGRISTNLTREISSHLRGGQCDVFSGDMKVRLDVAERDVFYYPDLLVSCDPEDNETYWRERPKLIIEVLSSDEESDRVVKYVMYQRISTLEEYVIVSQDITNPEVTVFRRDEDWRLGNHYRSLDELVELKSIDLQIPVNSIYENVVAKG